MMGMEKKVRSPCGNLSCFSRGARKKGRSPCGNLSCFSRGARKKGLEMAVTTVIMIILSITVLTILVVFFNSQTGFLSKWFKTQNTASNVDAVVSACDGLVTSESVYAYCCGEKEVVFGGNKTGVKLSCDNISKQDWSGGRLQEMDCSSVNCS